MFRLEPLWILDRCISVQLMISDVDTLLCLPLCFLSPCCISLRLPLPQRPSSLISDSSVEPVPSPSGSSPSSTSSTPSNDVTSAGPHLNITTCAVNVSHIYLGVHLLKFSLSLSLEFIVQIQLFVKLFGWLY